MDKTPDVVARPGDTLIIRLAGRLSDDEYAELAERWKPLVAAGLHVFLADFVEGITLFRPGQGKVIEVKK